MGEAKKRYWLHILLFLATVATTFLAGSFSSIGMFKAKITLETIFASPHLENGLMYSGALMGILLAHEMGHYLAARRHGVNVSLPYFIPAPPFLIGTFGAMIKLRERVQDRNALLDIAVAGPLAGIIVTIPILILGLSISEVKEITGGGLTEGNSILYLGLKLLVHGKIPEGQDVFLHPLAMAGWIGILVTFLNLIPYGQLDGGHVAHALLDQRFESLSRLIPLLLLVAGIFSWKGWLIWAIMLFLMGNRHPPTSRTGPPLHRTRRIFGYITIAVLLLTFTPIPLSVNKSQPLSSRASTQSKIIPKPAKGDHLLPEHPVFQRQLRESVP